MLSVVLLIVFLFLGIWFTNSVVLFSLHVFHFPHLPFWLSVAIGLAFLSWLLGD